MYLGVTISSDLSWAAHIDNTCSKARKRLGFLYRHFHSAKCDTISHLFKATVLPILDYCSSVWDPHHAVHSDKLEKVQKFTAKLATRKWSANYTHLLSQLGWPPLSHRRKSQKVLLCRRILLGHSVISPATFTPHPSPRLRHSHNLPLYRPQTRSHAHLNSFFPCVVPLWNSLPQDIVSARTQSSFKRKLKTHSFSPN